MDVTVEATQDEVVVNVLGYPADQGQPSCAPRSGARRAVHHGTARRPGVIEDSDDEELSPRTKKVLELYDELGNAAHVVPLVKKYKHFVPAIKRIIQKHRGRDVA